ncbi:hypothetical protein ACHAXH_004154 [Discostella pseudostelligera]
MRVTWLVFLLAGHPLGQYLPSLAAELVSSNYQFGDLRLQYLPPENDGGEPITKYKIEWDASHNDPSIPLFTPSSHHYGTAEVVNVREEQEIIVSCQNACSGTFLLSWGGRVANEPLEFDATPEEVEQVLSYLVKPFNHNSDDSSPVRVTRKANGFAFKWKVVFIGISGDLGLIQANGDLLVGSGVAVRVVEVARGLSDLYPGAYTNEVQTVSIRKWPGYGCETLAGNFVLSFDGKVTSSIDIDSSSEDFKQTLESLDTIHSVNVKTDHHNSSGAGDCASRSWIVSLTHLVHENRQGAGDIGLLRLSSSSLSNPEVTQLDIFENVKGTNPRAFSIRGLQHGLTYYCRVSAYNSLGFGVFSSIVSASPKSQPSPPVDPIVSIPNEVDNADKLGTTLSVSWLAVTQENGGDPVTEYKLEWYSDLGDSEVQTLTTSANDGETEIQAITISADAHGIAGFFTLSFNGETTELIAHDAEADGEESIEAKLERLSTVGDVEVSREYSWVSVPAVEFDLIAASNVLSRSGGAFTGSLVQLFDAGDMIRVGRDVHIVTFVAATSLLTDNPYTGVSAAAVNIHKWSFGYMWLVTFASHIGKQPLLIPSPADSWAGTNPVIAVSRVREGLHPLSGSMRLGFEGERTLPIPFDADAALMKRALESLSSIGEVDVTRYRNNNGHNYFITFVSELGDRELITVDDSQLMGPDARARVATLTDGTEPANYGSALTQHPTKKSLTAIMQYQIVRLRNGIPYFVRIRSCNSKGLGYASLASPSPMRPVKRPSPPTLVSMFPLSNTQIRISWHSPVYNGGLPVTKYAIQWDIRETFPSAWIQGFFHEKFVDENEYDGPDAIYCHTFTIDPISSDVTRYGRVMAFNGHQWSSASDGAVLSSKAAVGKPGPVREFNAFHTSNVGIMMTWSHPIINDSESCEYAGDGGSSITHYLIEYDEEADFSSPATSVSVPFSSTELRVGGRDVLSGSSKPTLVAGGTYYARITPFNSVGPGITTDFPSLIGPLDYIDPGAPVVQTPFPISASSIQVEWDAPTFDGGSGIREFVVEYDVSSSFQTSPKNISIPTISEVKAFQVCSNELDLNIHGIQATVAVTNEIQSIKTMVEGVDEVQEISTNCDDVTAEVQMIATTAVDTNEEQILSLISDDIDEIQLVRLQGNGQAEVQSVQVSIPRVNEVQRFGIVVSNINTLGDGVHSTACMGLNIGDPCPDIEHALTGSFTVSFDFDQCGSAVGGGVNYCQLALSEYEPSLGNIVCSPGLVVDPYLGGDHCVSDPVIHSFGSVEGDVGTLQSVLNELVDDNGVSFMTLSNNPGKQEAASVHRIGRIKTLGACTLDPIGSEPAICGGEYELLYEVTFDAVHSSGDVPPLTVVTSDFRINTTTSSYTNVLCPSSYYVHGCEEPAGAALDSNHGSFYNGEAGSIAIEAIKGSQPTGMITLDYECESNTVILPDGCTMSVSVDGMSSSFDCAGFVANVAAGQWVRFSAGDGIDRYRKIVGVDSASEKVLFKSQAPVNGATYIDVEIGDYFSDWDENDGSSGVSSHCQAARIHTTLPIDVSTFNSAVSVLDWKGKIGALSVIDSSGVSISRSIVPDLSMDVGLIWDITFHTQPGHVHEMACSSVSGNNQCYVNTLQDSSVVGGHFRLQTRWPHEYVTETPELFQTDSIRWNSDAQSVKASLEAITDSNGDKVFGLVNVSRAPYVPSFHSRWSGGYLWTITFSSRGGNIPALTYDDSLLTGDNTVLEVSDEDSGESDTYQGIRNSATFGVDDPGQARDGNQISGAFFLSWSGNAYHDPVVTTNVFTVQTGGSQSDRYTALSADHFKSLFEEYVLLNSVNQVDVVRSDHPTQWMGFSYTIIFRHEDVGGNVPPLKFMSGSPLGGSNSFVNVDESVKGTELIGTFQLRFEGETTRPISYDAHPHDIQDALNALNSIAPSAVVVSGGESPIRSGQADGSIGLSTQVAGRIWYVTFASNVWQDPTVVHDDSFVPGNWVGPAASFSDTWSSGFSKSWGKNVGNVPLMSCLPSGLSTTNGALPDGGCSVSELIAGTDPLGGFFKLCFDSASNPNNVMSVEADACTEFIAHNAVASADESGGDGSSMEEKLELLQNVGDIHVTRSSVNTRNGGYTWKIQFLHDVDGPCQQKDDILSLCNSPGNVPKLCDDGGATACDTSSLKGTCRNPEACKTLNIIDAYDKLSGVRLPGGNEKQAVFVKDSDYLGWEDGSVVDVPFVVKEYKLLLDGLSTGCIKHNALAEEVALSIQLVLDSGIGGSVRVDRSRSEHLAENGYVYFITFFDTGDIAPLSASFMDGACPNSFDVNQSVVITSVTDGSVHSETCEDCADGIVQRGRFTTFEVSGDGFNGELDWNAEAFFIKRHLEQSSSRVVDVTRTILDKYGAVEWKITFTNNDGSIPPGSGDILPITVVQIQDTSGRIADVVVHELIKGSAGLSGVFSLNYQSGGFRAFSFDETPQRMKRKLEEMSTIGSVFVTRNCYPSCSKGGWGGLAVAPGTLGGYEWKIYFLKNRGSNSGFTFPPGSGLIHPPVIDHTLLFGKDANVAMERISEGSGPFAGSFTLVINSEKTESIPYNADSSAIELAINELQSVGDVSVESKTLMAHIIPGITASVLTDGTVALINGGDLREHFAPGDMFRLGGSTNVEGADFVGSAALISLSPVLSNVQLEHRTHLHLGETIRIAADNYIIMKNGVEVQQLTVHRAVGVDDSVFYQLRVKIQDEVETTQCLTFNASASDVESALNMLPVLLSRGGVFVTRTDISTGFVGDAHIYKVYFSGEQLVRDVDEMVPERCDVGVPVEVDSTNSHIHVRTLVQGGKTEHQRITLSSDSGNTKESPAFRLTIGDASGKSWNSPCFAWGVPSLDIASIIDVDLFTSSSLVIDNISQTGNRQYSIGSPSFIEGVIRVGDYVNPGKRCPGNVISINGDGKSFLIESSGCTSIPGDNLFVGNDVGIVDSFTDNGASASELTVVTVFSSSGAIDSDEGLYKINVEFEGISRVTSCLPYGVSALKVQHEVGSLFDYNRDGVIDTSDEDHVTVSRKGDGSSSFGNGFSYEFLSKGSSSSIGPSAVLGSNAPRFSVIDVGADGGCVDYGVEDAFVTNLASTTDESNTISLGLDSAMFVTAGARLRASSSLLPSKVYTVDYTSDDGATLVLTENFDGATTSGTTTLHLIRGGNPQFDVSVTRKGSDEYVYDIFFIGSHWTNSPEITLNTFDDGVCSLSGSDLTGGMNRDFRIKTMVDGGGTIIDPGTDRYVLNKVARRGLRGPYDLFVVPPIFVIPSDPSEIQRMLVMDDDNDDIWGSGQPSFKLSFNGEYTSCLPYDSSEVDIEKALNALSSICSGPEPCVTVSRSEDPAHAPNGYVYTLYFDSSSVARKDIGDTGIDGLQADTANLDCVPFDSLRGEKIVFHSTSQGMSSADFSASQMPVTGNPVGRWIGEAAANLGIYRVSGTFWLVRFDQSLGHVALSIDSTELSSSSYASVTPQFFDGVNPDHAVLSGLSTGLTYFFRVYSRSNLGVSPPSDTVSSIPSDKPEKMRRVSSRHTFHRNEVQSLVIAATLCEEIQAVRTSATAIPEVQEIKLEGTETSDMNAYFFSLRHPEIQVVKWYAGSPVTDGSFFLKLRLVDRINSHSSGSIVYKEMRTPCIDFDATADDVKRAMEADALENGLGVDSVRVIRSGNRSFSSGYGYKYHIHFIGGDVRGNIMELTSDLALTGLDSHGGNSCRAFVSDTNDASLDIWTENDSLALGTDTPRVEVIFDADVALVVGEYQLSVTHYGQQLMTECIPWDCTAEHMKSVLENLENVDSVRVDRTGDGEILDNGGRIHIDSVFFTYAGGSSFSASPSEDVSNLLSEGDTIKLSAQSDFSTFYKIISLENGIMVLDKPFVGDISIPSYVTHYFGFRYIIYFDGNAMHLGESDSTGYLPVLESNFVLVNPQNCKPLQAYHDNVLLDVSEIPGGSASVRAVSKYNGGHTLPGAPMTSSSVKISNSLTSSLPMTISKAQVTQSLVTSENGLTFTVSYGSDDGDLPLVICNQSPLMTSLVACDSSTVTDGNEIRGSFYLESSAPIIHDASPLEMGTALGDVIGVGHVEVSRSQPDGQKGYTWLITFSEDLGDFGLLSASNSLLGSGATLSVTEVVKGNELGGSFTLQFGSETTEMIPYDVDVDTLRSKLESLDGIGRVYVDTDGIVDSERGRSFSITFLDAEYADVPLLVPDSTELSGYGAVITVAEVVKGSFSSKNALFLSFDMPRSCSNSDVGRAYCGDPISEVIIEFSQSTDFIGLTSSYHYFPDYSTQIIRISCTGGFPTQSFSGYFNVAYDGYLSAPINAGASAISVRKSLEELPGIVTAGVERSYSSQVVDGSCVNVAVGSSTVRCSSSCMPCSFGSKGIKANQLIRLGDEWHRVSSSYDGVQESFAIATVTDVSMETLYLGSINLDEHELYVWTGGYEWTVHLHRVIGEVKPLTTPSHHMLPREAAIEISTVNCNQCVVVDNLMPDTQYFFRARAKNNRGWSDFSDIRYGTPRAIPSAPTNVRVNIISGGCLEVEFDPPVYGDPLTSFVVQWDYNQLFTHSRNGILSSCVSLRYGSCVLGVGSPPIKHEICGLLESEEYFVRVAARNSVKIQTIYPSGYPTENTNWSGVVMAVPSNQVPVPPLSLKAIVLGYDGIQISFDWPKRDGGKDISEFIVFYDTVKDFSTANQIRIASSIPQKIPNNSNMFIFDFSPTTPSLKAGSTYFIKMSAVNDIGAGTASDVASVTPSGPPSPPQAAILTTLQYSNLPVTEATISWIPPDSSGGYPIDGCYVEWWSEDKLSEVQIVRLRYSSILSQSTFTLSFSPSPTVKKVTSNLPWNAPADLVRRELLNLGWDEDEDMTLITDLKVTRSPIANGYQWAITFGDDPNRDSNDGDQVSLVGSVFENGDVGSPTITVSTYQDGRRPGGCDEVQYLQILGTGILSGHYRLKVSGSQWTSFIPVHATAAYIKNALEQLSTISAIEVIQNDLVDQSLVGTDGDLVHHYEIHFLSKHGNVDAIVVDAKYVASTSKDVRVAVFDGSNALDSLHTKESAATPGELPAHYGTSGKLDPTVDTYTITGLITGMEYFVVVSARNYLHGVSKHITPVPPAITPPLQAPGIPQSVGLEVNSGYSDSLVINFDAPASNGGTDILFYRVELDPTPSFDSPIVQDFECPASNRQTEWEIETSTSEGVINGGSFRLELEVDGFTSFTAEIPHDAVSLSSEEIGIYEELLPNFSTSDSNTIATVPPINIEDMLFPGDRLRFSGQTAGYKYYAVESVSGTVATLSEAYIGEFGVQMSTTRHYGGRGSPHSSRIHCQFDEDLCPIDSETKSGSLQSKLEDLHLAIRSGVFVDRDGPSHQNGFLWRVTFMDDAYPQGSDYTLRVYSNSLTTFDNQGSANVAVRLLNSGKTFTSCTGPLIMPSLGGLVKGLHYYGRVSARNSVGYSLPGSAPESMAPIVIPGAPTGVTLDVISATELRVIFGSPPDNGGDTVTEYLIEWSETSDFQDSLSSRLVYLAGGSPFFKNIEGLITGTRYYVRVMARNSQGYGISQMSTPASLNPHQRPSPPTNVKLGITSDTMITIGWDPPLSNGGDSILKYRIEWDTKPTFASSSYLPNKGYVDVAPSVKSKTIQLLSNQKSYSVRVFAMNTAGFSLPQVSTPTSANPSLQVPGKPHSLQAVPGQSPGTINVSWQRPMIPAHSIPCFSDGPIVSYCPTPYGGSIPASDGGDDITEYELEYNERSDFLGNDGGRRIYIGVYAVLNHMYSGRTYHIRILARNSIGSGKYSNTVSAQAS